MRSKASLLFAFPLAALAATFAPDAAACGGCFHGEGENTQVTGHRMILSVSPAETTLWDQFQYAGEPTSFAWVLPVKGTVEIGLSSDALFEQLIQSTVVQVAPPPLNCPFPPNCYYGNGGGGGGLAFGDAGGPPPVSVVAQEVVGPYETVVLHSTDPAALTDWLATHGYVIPADFAPVIDAYIADGFDFLALKLVPGADVKSMKPVRVTTPGAGATLPLRMVGAGVGATTPITLWVFGEGRYQPANFPWFVITEDQLTWDFAQSASNYKALRQAGFDATQGRGWLMETASPFSPWVLTGPLQSLAQYDPVGSGYADDMGMGAPEALSADVDKLWGKIDMTHLWVSRMYAELPRAALAQDLTIGAAPSQAVISPNLTAAHGLNPPPCPEYPPCPGTGGAGGSGAGGAGGSGGDTGTVRDGGGCAVEDSGSPDPAAALGAVAVALGLQLIRRRRA